MMWFFPYRRAVSGLLMGTALASASLLLPAPQAVARAALYFPPARTVEWRHPGDGEVRQEPRDWARSLLFSARAGELIRQTLDPEASAEAAAASSLLGEDDHLQIQAREPGLLDLEINYDRPEVSLTVCQAVVAFLKTEVLVERGRRVEAGLAGLVREQADALERQEKAESEIVRQIRQQRDNKQLEETELGFLGRNSQDPVDPMARQDFLSGLAATRRLRSRELHLALQEETSLPGFSVMEPPHLESPGRPVWYTPVAAVLGLLLGIKLTQPQPAEKKNGRA